MQQRAGPNQLSVIGTLDYRSSVRMCDMAQNALITGVGRRRGIGAGIAAGLLADGWDLALSYWHPYDERQEHWTKSLLS